jgi:hypothetical protein
MMGEDMVVNDVLMTPLVYMYLYGFMMPFCGCC